ncbi:MAG: MMPL family transporter, partial [Myxococcales bacterium]|nr:MMPL family transporter [Myxococcales bacterium]
IIRAFAASVGPRPGPAPRFDPVARTLADRLGVPAKAAPALDAALCLVAEHELNVSTFAARVAASGGADLYASVGAALYAFSGPRHGSAPVRIAGLVDELGSPRRAKAALLARLERGETVPGFGHRLYPGGDPRTLPLVRWAQRLARGKQDKLQTLLAAADAMAGLGPHPSEAALEGALDATLSAPEAVVALREALGDEDVGEAREDLLLSLPTRLDEAWRRRIAGARAQAALTAAGVDVGELGPRLVRRLTDELETLDAPTAMVPAAGDAATGHLAVRVSGLPVLHRGMSQSATHNQIYSLLLALGLVVIILSVTYRSVRLGLVAASPTILTLLLIYGGMGWLGVHLDIGTSMLASIIIGAGVDYAVHLVSAWREHSGPGAATLAVRETGPAIWTNALMVAAGFFLLTLGEARTLQNVGGLTAAAMLTAAIATFLAVPVLMARSHEAMEAQEGAPISKDNLLEG